MVPAYRGEAHAQPDKPPLGLLQPVGGQQLLLTDPVGVHFAPHGLQGPGTG